MMKRFWRKIPSLFMRRNSRLISDSLKLSQSQCNASYVELTLTDKLPRFLSSSKNATCFTLPHYCLISEQSTDSPLEAAQLLFDSAPWPGQAASTMHKGFQSSWHCTPSLASSTSGVCAGSFQRTNLSQNPHSMAIHLEISRSLICSTAMLSTRTMPLSFASFVPAGPPAV